MRKHSGMVVVWLGMASVVGCGGVAHSLGGGEVKQTEDNSGGSGGARESGETKDSDAGVVSPGTGGTTSTGTGGETSTGGTTSSWDGGTAGSPGFTAGPCGECENVLAEGITFAGCCLDDGTCGVDSSNATFWAHSSDSTRGVPGGCQPRDQPGLRDTSCKSQSAPFVDLSGCCRPDGTCGVDLGVLQLGCVRTVVLSSEPAEDGGALSSGTTPSPDTCVYSPDAG